MGSVHDLRTRAIAGVIPTPALRGRPLIGRRKEDWKLLREELKRQGISFKRRPLAELNSIDARNEQNSYYYALYRHGKRLTHAEIGKILAQANTLKGNR
jgi:hypothetical protein